MSDIDAAVAWLRGALDDEERAALDAGGRHWKRDLYGCVVEAADNRLVVKAPRRAQADHIARQDPKHTLAVVAAHRKILDRHAVVADETLTRMYGPLCAWCSTLGAGARQKWPCPDVLDLIDAYADRPDHPDVQPTASG